MPRFAVPIALAASLLGVAASGQTPAKPKSALDKATLEAYLRHQFMLPPALKVVVGDSKASDVPGLLTVDVLVTDGAAMKQQVQFYVTKDGAKILQGKSFDIRESPFAPELKLLKSDGHASLGPANARVTILVFSDFQCQYCREEAKTLRQHLAKEYANDVRLVFRDFPLEQIHPWAKPAAMIGRCVLKQNPAAFWEYHDWIFDQQASITPETLKAKSLDFAGAKSIDALQLSQCVDGKLTEKEVDASSDDARALQVTSTPTLFVNGRRLVGNVPWDQLKGVIDYEMQHAIKIKKEEEACCEVKLAIPGAK